MAERRILELPTSEGSATVELFRGAIADTWLILEVTHRDTPHESTIALLTRHEARELAGALLGFADSPLTKDEE